ncbi:hypothetical protein LLUC08_1169 [Lactococcus lactis subsp. lactis]|uniref:Uncharacterized protein n=1 Tax=Lactococcus lactis subsp. lactis TaxID=1360 RepID=A0AAC9R521_LACLL|nr:hypothetical protein [Lactococcus lactis]ARE13501.1 hypothetical protein LLUC11_1168 [Lactococcus lactis subsp. lactis]ARE15911.1 hypothetical protein LLUC08_1169 [Lactococcus lactis subsp. lactis]
MANILDLDKPVDIDYSEFLKKDFPKGQLIPLELAVKNYLEGKKPKPSVIYKEAVDYINSLDSPLETLCYTNRRTRTERMIWVILFVVQVIYTFLFYLNTLSWVISLIAFVSFPIILFMVFLILFVHDSYNDDVGERIVELLFPEKHRKTKDFEMFIEALEKYKFNNIKNFVLFIQKKEIRRFGTSFGWKFQYDFNITYDLFNRVKTFALESFLIAEQREDEEALEKILTPMVQDILNEAVEKYQKFKKIEQDFDDSQKKQLKKQIAVDIETYEKRMFKKIK